MVGNTKTFEVVDVGDSCEPIEEPCTPRAGASPSTAGLPPWVTEDFIEETIRVWQPHSEIQLTRMDAMEIILNMSHLLDVLVDKEAT